jgi:hypothetical protein
MDSNMESWIKSPEISLHPSEQLIRHAVTRAKCCRVLEIDTVFNWYRDVGTKRGSVQQPRRIFGLGLSARASEQPRPRLGGHPVEPTLSGSVRRRGRRSYLSFFLRAYHVIRSG